MNASNRVTGNPELIEQYRRVHAERAYGTTSVKSLRVLRADIKLLRPASVLDYGCGQSRLLDQLRLGYSAELIRYDPAIPAWAIKPGKRVDLLISIDVLEHIEERDLDTVLAEMVGLCRNAMIIVDTRPAATILPDGRNAHVTIRPQGWWGDRIGRHFPKLHPLPTVRRSRAGFMTWSRNPWQTPRYLGLRAADTARYVAGRLATKLGTH